MLPIPFVPINAPFSLEQRAWINGYLAGLFTDASNSDQKASLTESPPPEPLLVLFGSQTGSAEQIAKQVVKEASRRGMQPRLMEANKCSANQLLKEKRLLLVTSTWGDGEPPDNALEFWRKLTEPDCPRLEHLTYSVLALGDKNYADFCGAGKKFDARLENLGANRLAGYVECDTEYEPQARIWIESLWLAFQTTPEQPATTTQPTTTKGISETPKMGRQNPFRARLVTNRRLNRLGSSKDTRHFEIEIGGSGLSYEVGDALGVIPKNCPSLVQQLITALKCDGDESVRQALLSDFQITQPTTALLTAVAHRSASSELSRLLEPQNKTELDQYLYGRDILDILLSHPQSILDPAEFLTFLRKLQPRLYSISSSPKAHPNQVHLTVATVKYEAHGRTRSGVCSTWLAERVDEKTPVPIFVQTSHGFRLPADSNRRMIMVGPGTGVAPFRAFLEERRATGARGSNWLFFGDQQQSHDFLYEDELNGMVKDQTLTRLDLAFSRDQPEKIYVQNRMLESASTLFDWLENGANFYVCGDAKRMAKDVDQALRRIIQQEDGKTLEQANDYMNNLVQEKRYQRDVY